MPASIGAVSELRLSGRFSVTDSTPSARLDGQIVDAGVRSGLVDGRIAWAMSSEPAGPRSESTWLYK